MANREFSRIARRAALLAGLAGSMTLAAGGVAAHSGEKHAADPHPAAKPAATSEAAAATPLTPGTRDARTYFTDTELLTQDGRAVRFYSDVLEDRVVLINVVFTHCEDACPLITKKLNDVRAKLGERAKDVWFVTISTDPERDSPQALKKFAKAQGVDEARWVFLTGDKAKVDQVLARLGQLGESPEAHSTLLIAGNVGAKRWSKIRPDAPPVAIAERLQVLAGKP